MVKNSCVLLLLLIISSCCFKNTNNEREGVWFEEHPITEREKNWVENSLKWYEPYVLENLDIRQVTCLPFLKWES